ncbi:hypothetical protein COY27_05745 [Candidatus Woesearchaeota archaeon CG_4_10_14_0_2_um_filter_33_13]|nr:MAG: hypothetical protein COY27_05745 [Candidatus Woesearchaeota archaeon CG_4_10_14_0_2_um_filter_33_13]
MDLRELKKEVELLPSVDKHLKGFQDSWIKPIRSNTNQHIPFLQDLPQETKQELNRRLQLLSDSFQNVKDSQLINDKLKHYARYLIELKLTTFNGDQSKSKMLSSRMLNDDFLNIKQTITEVQNFESHVKHIEQNYHEVNQLLHKQLSLEEVVFFMELPHLKYLKGLLKLADDHKVITRDIGRHLVVLTKQTQLGGRR